MNIKKSNSSIPLLTLPTKEKREICVISHVSVFLSEGCETLQNTGNTVYVAISILMPIF